jgi:pyruvate/2-oxoglutarate dehydrogenase complex dihydrolipoamide dehydrogenase (E3) component
MARRLLKKIPRQEPFGIIVIGGGPAGIAGATTALGKRPALVESQPELGGAGANTGTVPGEPP